MIRIEKKQILALLKQCNNKLYQLLSRINEDYHGYLAEYEYGTKIADTENFYYPHDDALHTRDTLPGEISSDLSLYKNSIPFGIVLGKCFEMTVDNDKYTIPSTLYRKGDLFGYFSRMGENHNDFSAPPIYSAYSGARSAFCVSNLGNLSLFSSLRDNLPPDTTAPKTLYDHYKLFSAIAKSYSNSNKWKVKMIVFNGEFFEKISNNADFLPIKNYLFNQYWLKAELFRNKQNYDYVTSEILYNLESFKPDPYLTGTLRHFISIFLNVYPAFAPLINNEQAPVDLLQRVLINEYKIESSPIIIGLEYFNKTNLLYYPLNYMSTFTYSRNYAKQQTVWEKLDAIKRLADVFFNKYKKSKINAITSISKLLPEVEMHCFHTKHYESKNIVSTDELQKFDKRMTFNSNMNIAKTSPFLRGLIAFKKND